MDFHFTLPLLELEPPWGELVMEDESQMYAKILKKWDKYIDCCIYLGSPAQ